MKGKGRRRRLGGIVIFSGGVVGVWVGVVVAGVSWSCREKFEAKMKSCQVSHGVLLIIRTALRSRILACSSRYLA